MSPFSQHLKVFCLQEPPKSQDDLKKIYRHLISRCHPDRYESVEDIKIATLNSQLINTSYQWLSEYFEKCGFENLSQPKPKEPNYVYRNTAYTPGFPDPNVFEYFVKSSHIVSIGYRADTRVLYVKFQHTGVYRYFDVPQTLFESFIMAESPGSFRNKFIDNYRYEACKEKNVAYAPDPSILLAKGR